WGGVGGSGWRNTLGGLFWNWGACGFSAAIVFAASAASRAKCSLRAASRNVHQTGIDRWPSRSILPSGSRPASRAISRARSWYGSDRSMPCTWLLPPADATLRARRFRNEPVGHGVLLVVVAPLPAFLAVEAGARPDQPIIGMRRSGVSSDLWFPEIPSSRIRAARQNHKSSKSSVPGTVAQCPGVASLTP